jgi:type I restriction enzyme, S subunit
VSELPPGWRLAKLGDLGAWSSGGTPSRGNDAFYGPGIPWVRTGDLPDGPLTVIPESITELGLKNSSAKRFPPGTLLVAMYGATIGKLGILTREAATNQACAALLPSNGTAESIPYIFQYLLSQREQLRKIGQGGAQPNISQGILKDYEIPWPPVCEQKRIVAKLETLQGRSRNAREALDSIPPLIEKLRQSILAAAFRGDLTKDWRAKNPDVEPASELLKRIRIERRKMWEAAELARLAARGRVPHDDRWKTKYAEPADAAAADLRTLPTGWAWTSLEVLASLVTDGDHNPPKRVASGIPHLTAKNIRNQAITLDGCSFVTDAGFRQTSERYAPRAGDVIVTCVGTLGQTAIVPSGLKFSADRNLAAVRLVPGGVAPEFLQGWLNTRQVQALLGIASGSTAQPHLYLGDLRSVPVPVAPLQEQLIVQESVSIRTSALDSLVSLAAGATRHVAMLESAVLSHAFRRRDPGRPG